MVPVAQVVCEKKILLFVEVSGVIVYELVYKPTPPFSLIFLLPLEPALRWRKQQHKISLFFIEIENVAMQIAIKMLRNSHKSKRKNSESILESEFFYPN
jgi:hypothetical protein